MPLKIEREKRDHANVLFINFFALLFTAGPVADPNKKYM
jgi:hypothetical protein